MGSSQPPHSFAYLSEQQALHQPDIRTDSSSSYLPPPPSDLLQFSPSHVSRTPTRALGRTRCYWSILSSNLDFVFLDPILYTHLGDESSLLLGTNLLNYIHPEEQENMRDDLVSRGSESGGGVESGGVFGSVTRCRYSRISRIRRLLGCVAPPTPVDANLYVLDDDFIELNITTSWIGGLSRGKKRAGGIPKGAVLAFFHATGDKNATEDADEHHLSSWTNWCGPHSQDGVYLDSIRCQQLSYALQQATSSSPSSSDSGSDEEENRHPEHVFQILDASGGVMLSFPPAAIQGLDSRGERKMTSTRYDVEEYGTLAREVVARPRGPVDATTSCTGRYRSKHPVLNLQENTLTTIESVVILYGAITFACFQTGGVYRSQHATTEPSLGAGHFELEDVPTRTAASSAKRELEEMGFLDSVSKRQRRLNEGRPSHPALSIAPNRHYPLLFDDGTPTDDILSPTVVSASAILGSFSNDHSSGPQYDIPTLSRPNQYQQQFQQSHSYQPHPLQQNHFPTSEVPLYQPHQYLSQLPQVAASASYSSSFGSLSPIDRREGEESLGIKKEATSKVKTEPVMKVGPKACESCGIVNSPEWRKGPGGTKSLCNACGLRYARQVARKKKMAEGEGGGLMKPDGPVAGKSTIMKGPAKPIYTPRPPLAGPSTSYTSMSSFNPNTLATTAVPPPMVSPLLPPPQQQQQQSYFLPPTSATYFSGMQAPYNQAGFSPNGINGVNEGLLSSQQHLLHPQQQQQQQHGGFHHPQSQDPNRLHQSPLHSPHLPHRHSNNAMQHAQVLSYQQHLQSPHPLQQQQPMSFPPTTTSSVQHPPASLLPPLPTLNRNNRQMRPESANSNHSSPGMAQAGLPHLNGNGTGNGNGIGNGNGNGNDGNQFMYPQPQLRPSWFPSKKDSMNVSGGGLGNGTRSPASLISNTLGDVDINE